MLAGKALRGRITGFLVNLAQAAMLAAGAAALMGFAAQGLAAPPAISAQQAEKLVQNLPEVKELLARKSGPKHKVILDDEEARRYVLRLVVFMPAQEGLPSRMTTVNWYAVDKATGRAYSITPGVD